MDSNPLVTKMRNSLALAHVQKRIFCPMSKRVLDIRTVKFLVDSDNDPAYPLDPDAFAELLKDPVRLEVLERLGYVPQHPDDVWC